MTFSEADKTKVLAIVHIFETSRPFGDYAACVVLNDGAGISYGINQFTHRSGSLAAVVREYLRSPTEIPAEHRRVFQSYLPQLSDNTPAAVRRLSEDSALKQVLRQAAAVPAMQAAQRRVAYSRYLRPALDVCSRFGFVHPLSLAVVYDSITHGSWDLISARVGAVRSVFRRASAADEFEKAWIADYVSQRHRWLTEVKRLRATNYRTRFFLKQIRDGNWGLKLPVDVHGVRLTDDHLAHALGRSAAASGEPTQTAPVPPGAAETNVSLSTATSTMLQTAGDLTSVAAAKFDRVDQVVTTVRTRSDAAKSLWATVAGTATQIGWGIFGFVAGLPRFVWVVVALLAAALMLLYLYRQIVLGRIREMRVS